MKKLIALLLALVMALSLLAGCAKQEPAKDEPAANNTADAPADKQITVGVDLYYRRDEYYVDLESTFKAYGAEKGYNMVICDADGDVATQINQVEDFITQGVDVILLAAADPDAMIAPVQEAIDAGIPVICYDGTINSDMSSVKAAE